MCACPAYPNIYFDKPNDTLGPTSPQIGIIRPFCAV